MPTYQEFLQAAYDRTQPQQPTRADAITTEACRKYIDKAIEVLDARWGEGNYLGHQVAKEAYDRVRYPHFYDKDLNRIE